MRDNLNYEVQMKSNKEIKKAVETKIFELIEKFDNSYEVMSKENFDFPKISFNKKGSISGSFSSRDNEISFNFTLLKENYDKFMETTVVHEVSHFICYVMFGHQYSRSGRHISHGRSWKSIMNFFGVPAKRCHSYNCDSVRTISRAKNTFLYKCNCREVELSSIRHNRARKGSIYVCNLCKSNLVEVK